jgi:hypothetical protein
MRELSVRTAPGYAARTGLLFLILAAGGCGPGRRAAGEAIFPYIDAVQASNYDLIRCLYAGPQLLGGTAAADTDFNAWVDGRLAAFEKGKSRGQVDLESDGITMIKAFGLGTGTLLGIASVRSKGGDLEVLTPATFNYDEIDAPSLPDKATFLVAVLPLGTVTTVEIKEGSGRMSLDVLKNLTFRWTLKRVEPKGICRSDWRVASVAAVPESAKTVRVEWKF